jgi:hypothetical protein
MSGPGRADDIEEILYQTFLNPYQMKQLKKIMKQG